MTTWNEAHYARAEEFTRLLADALTAAKHSAPVAVPEPAPLVRPASPPPAAPAPVAPPPAPAPAAATPATPAPASTPAAGSTAASVFKKIPWKK